MIAPAVPRFSSSARTNAVAGILLLWSMRTTRLSFFVTLHSIHEPRSGMTRKPCSGRSPSCSSMRKSMPGERWSWLTMTRSAPFTMNSPPPTMIGSSPR